MKTTTQSKKTLFDFDANLTHPLLQDHVDEVVNRARMNGIEKMLVPGSSLEESLHSIRLAQLYPKVLYATAGIHPYNVNTCNSSSMSELRILVDHPSVFAFGECGLDYSEGFPEKELQLEWFEAQIQLSCEIGKPLFLHERLAFSDFNRILNKYDRLPPAVIHCFTGTSEELRYYLAKGYYIGFTGYICKSHGENLRGVLQEYRDSSRRELLLDRLVIETDSPYMGFPNCRQFCPSKKKQQSPNDPSSLILVAERIAECLNLTPENVAELTTRNAKTFLRID